MDLITLDNCPIGNIRLEKNYSKYNISARIGEYYEFDYSKISNERHCHDCYELVLILKGRGTFLYGNESYQLKEGALFLTEPFVEHEIHISQNENMILLYLMFNISEKKGKSSLLLEERLIDRFLSDHKNISVNQKQLFSYIAFFEKYVQGKGSRNDIWFIIALENFLLNCLEVLSEEIKVTEAISNLSGDTYEKSLDYIDKNLSRKITAQEISEAVNTSKRNLYRIFTKNMNRSVNDYVNEKKIFLAGYYLKMNISVTESASLVGIDNLSQFNKLFHKYLDMSPREYRNKYRFVPQGFGRRRKID